ncbi:MAG: hypothetical protein ISR73_03575 [Gammaproteobacteria bacterium]|nr:hypothetical protein [Gammaproteobacteria bacterium]
MMIDLIENLKVIAVQSRPAEALIIKAAIDRIKELEARLSDYEEDITDWQISVEAQMRSRKGDK